MEQLSKVFNFEGNEVRTVLVDGEPWFVAKDVCAVLGLSNVSLAVNGNPSRGDVGLDEDEKGVCIVNTLGGKQSLLCVTESGLYQLIFKSRKPEAHAFKRWVTHELLPSVRKHQAYITPTKLEELIRDPDIMIGLLQELKHEQQERARLQAEVAIIQPKADKYTEFLDSEGLTAFTTIGKHFLGGVEAPDLRKFLQGHGVLYGREVDKCFPPRKGYEQYFRIIPYYRGGYLLNKSVKATPAGIDFIVELYRKHDGKIPEQRKEKRTVTPDISVNVRKSA